MEIELKFLVSNKGADALSTVLNKSHYQVEQQPTLTLSNAYYDTADNTLREWDFGLRTRCSESDNGKPKIEQTIKLSGTDVGGLQQRPEFTEALTNTQFDFVFADLSLFDTTIWPKGFVAEDIQPKLTKIFATNFSRQVWLLTTPSGTVIECVLDDGVVEVNQQNEIRQQAILEFELELLKGDVTDLFEVANYITSKIDAKLGYLSKAARGYGLAQNNEMITQNLEPFKFESNELLEPAFIHLLTHAIKFIQHHEVVFAETQSLKSLRRILDGISLLIHILQLFSEYLPNSQCVKFLESFKQWRGEHGWIEAFYQLDQLTGRKSPYRKDIEKSEFLRSTLSSIKMPDDKLEKSLGQFSSKSYNHLFLSFIQWINKKQWRNEMPLKALNTLTLPISDVSANWLDFHWMSLKESLSVLSKQSNVLDIESSFWPLTKVLLSGICVDSLYDSEERKRFRSHLLNLMVGFEESILLQKSQQVLLVNDSSSTDQQDTIKWLQSKQESLQMALDASITACLKLKPYWI